MKKRYNQAAVISVAYLLLCAAAFYYHILRHEYDKFSAIFIGILTLPWSLIAAFFKDLIIAGTFQYEFDYVGNAVILLICAVINTILIFIIFNKRKKI